MVPPWIQCDNNSLNNRSLGKGSGWHLKPGGIILKMIAELLIRETGWAGAIVTKPSELCVHANILFGSQWTIGCMGPNNRFAWTQICEGFVNMAPHGPLLSKECHLVTSCHTKFVRILCYSHCIVSNSRMLKWPYFRCETAGRTATLLGFIRFMFHLQLGNSVSKQRRILLDGVCYMPIRGVCLIGNIYAYI
jgi:hypothetical protein